ncbi:hypothetical protein ACGF07_33620 [Kitasatospora sp. NPDC048194]
MSATDAAADLERRVQQHLGRIDAKHADDRADAATAAEQQTGGRS